MIYMVEMNLPDASRRAAWDAWYLGHIRKLLTVPGFDASQRFEAVVETASPFLALHEVASAAVFDSPAYRAKGGPAATGEWQARMTDWHRNLLDGVDETPDVPAGMHLLVLTGDTDPALDDPALISIGRIAWARGTGLDRSRSRVGLAVVDEPARLPALTELARRDGRVCLYRPITEKLR